MLLVWSSLSTIMIPENDFGSVKVISGSSYACYIRLFIFQTMTSRCVIDPYMTSFLTGSVQGNILYIRFGSRCAASRNHEFSTGTQNHYTRYAHARDTSTTYQVLGLCRIGLWNRVKV